MSKTSTPWSIPSCLLATLLAAACGAEPDAQAGSAEASAGDEAAPAAEAADGTEADAAPAEAAEPDPMQQVQAKVIQLGVNKAALERTLENPQVDCARAESQRDRICGLTDDICTAAESAPDAQAQCDNARGKCEAAKADVKQVRCRG